MRRALLVPLPAAALAGCSLLGRDATPCRQADADSQVSGVWRSADFGGPDAAVIRLCVDDTCEARLSGDPGDPFTSPAVRLPDDVGGWRCRYGSPCPPRAAVTRSSRTASEPS
ncbi:hypothetical protein [Streptomyces fumanus]|uniref:hypothetical protein n=1 Tax=Streptomyces fumanus TaxID=67302 RepID=UPI0033C567DD